MEFEVTSETVERDGETVRDETVIRVNDRTINPRDEPLKALGAGLTMCLALFAFLLAASVVFEVTLTAIATVVTQLGGYIAMFFVLFAVAAISLVTLGAVKYYFTGSAEPFCTIKLPDDDSQ